MPNTLTSFYRAIDAKLEENTVHFSTSDSPNDLKNKNTITPIPYRGCLMIDGIDATKFLQGQLTCNLDELEAQHSLLGAACNPKGRMYSSFRLLQQSDTQVLMMMDKTIIPITQKSLAKYIVFSKAELVCCADEYVALGMNGPETEHLLKEIFQRLPKDTHDVEIHSINKQQFHIIKANDKNRYEILCPIAIAKELWDKLHPNFILANSDFWRLLTIEDGVGEITADTIDLFIPQMLNYNTLGAISFNKGCYTGQEIIARMEYRGKLKRHLYRLQCISALRPLPGSEVYADLQKQQKSEQKPQSMGNVVSCAPTSPGHWEVLAVITDTVSQSNELSISSFSYDNNTETSNTETSNTTQKLSLLPLPYAITNSEGSK